MTNAYRTENSNAKTAVSKYLPCWKTSGHFGEINGSMQKWDRKWQDKNGTSFDDKKQRSRTVKRTWKSTWRGFLPLVKDETIQASVRIINQQWFKINPVGVKKNTTHLWSLEDLKEPVYYLKMNELGENQAFL